MEPRRALPLSVPLPPLDPAVDGYTVDASTPRALSWLASALDAAVVGAMRLVVERALLPDAQRIDAIRRSAEPFLAADVLHDPRRLLALDERPRLPLAATVERRRALPGGVAVTRRLYTAHAPHDPVRLEHWVHEPRRATTTMLAIHGFTMGWPRIDAAVLLAAEWFRHGVDVALLTLPCHGARTPAGGRFSGDPFARPDVGELNATAIQALAEILLATRWLREACEQRVGLLGLSLGGYLAATAAAFDPELAFVVPVVPPACFGDLAWRFLVRSRLARDAASAALTYEELRLAYRVHSPLTYAPAVPRERLLIVAGHGDRIVPPEHPLALWRHWGEPAIHWFGGSHLAPFGRKGLVRAVARHLEAHGAGLVATS